MKQSSIFVICVAILSLLLVSGCSEQKQPNSSANATTSQSVQPNKQTAKTDNKNDVSAQNQRTHWTEKRKMDLLIPAAKQFSLSEEHVRNIVKVMDSCGVDYDKIAFTNATGKQGPDQIYFEVKTKSPLEKYLLRIDLWKKIVKRIEIMFLYEANSSCDFLLYLDEDGKILSRNAFSLAYSWIDDEMKEYRKPFIKSRDDFLKNNAGEWIKHSQYEIPCTIYPGGSIFSYSQNIEDLIKTKKAYVIIFQYTTKSKTYGKTFDKETFIGLYEDGILTPWSQEYIAQHRDSIYGLIKSWYELEDAVKQKKQ